MRRSLLRIALAALCLALGAVGLDGQSYTITPTPFQVVLDNAGAIVSGACVWTYQAGTTTPATTYSDTSGTTNTNPIIADSAGRYTAFLTPGQSYKFVYESACTPPAHGTTLRTADNIIAVPSNSGGVDVVGTAGEALSAGNAVYLSDGSGSKTAGDWYKADNTNGYSSTTNPVGMITAAIASGATGTVRVQGSITGLTSLTIGLPYYIGTSGAITSSKPTSDIRRLGFADTTSSLVLQPDRTLPFAGDIETVPWTDYTSSSTITGWASFTSNRKFIVYKKVGTLVFIVFHLEGTSNSTSASFTLPYSAESSVYGAAGSYGGALSVAEDNTSLLTVAAAFRLVAGANTVNCFSNMGTGTWTASGTKIVEGEFWYVTSS